MNVKTVHVKEFRSFEADTNYVVVFEFDGKEYGILGLYIL